MGPFFTLLFLQFSCVTHSTTLFFVAHHTKSLQWHNNACWNVKIPWSYKHKQRKLISCTRSYYVVSLVVPPKHFQFSFYIRPLKTWIWTMQVHLWAVFFFFYSKYSWLSILRISHPWIWPTMEWKQYFPSVIENLRMQRAKCIHCFMSSYKGLEHQCILLSERGGET